MQNYLFQALEWLRASWASWGFVRKVLSVSALVFAVGLLVRFAPTVGLLKEGYALANPDVQLMLLLALVAVVVFVSLFAFAEWHRVQGLTEEKEAAERAKAEAADKVTGAETEVARLQAQWDNLLAVGCKDVLWKREPVVVPPPFVPKSNRATRFVTVLNLKGGVGKTTLAANLAAGLASGPSPLRVLLIDIDFQGTLSRATVAGALIEEKVKHDSLVHRLLTAPDADAMLLDRLAATMSGVSGGRVILADENLDHEEFQLQARFFVDPKADPRFRFRLHLHQPGVFHSYDVVLFDSPPRVTTSVVNALACSDYVLVPTKLDDGSIGAVPRALAWMKSLGSVCPAELLGVIASHARVLSGALVKGDNDSYEYLRRVVESNCGDAKKVLKAVVPHSMKAVGSDGEIGSLTADGQKVFAAVVKEVRGRMGV